MSRGSVHHNSECAQTASAKMAHIWTCQDGSDGFGALSASMAKCSPRATIGVGEGGGGGALRDRTTYSVYGLRSSVSAVSRTRSRSPASRESVGRSARA